MPDAEKVYCSPVNAADVFAGSAAVTAHVQKLVYTTKLEIMQVACVPVSRP